VRLLPMVQNTWMGADFDVEKKICHWLV
jgi:hypothetical protein